MDANNKKLINWLIDFAYLDFDNVGDREAVKITAEVRSVLACGILGIGSGFDAIMEGAGTMIAGGNNPFDSKEIDRVRDLQASFHKGFESMMGIIDKLPEHEGLSWTPYGKLPNYFLMMNIEDFTLSAEANIKIPYDIKPPYNIKPHDWKEDSDGTWLRWKSNWREEGRIDVTTRPHNAEKLMFFMFFNAINGLPITSFRRCEECNRWFLHTSRRERRYCNNRCAARKANRDRRARKKEKDPESYKIELKENARRARRSYGRRVHAITPGAKIDRRPRKKK